MTPLSVQRVVRGDGAVRGDRAVRGDGVNVVLGDCVVGGDGVTGRCVVSVRYVVTMPGRRQAVSRGVRRPSSMPPADPHRDLAGAKVHRLLAGEADIRGPVEMAEHSEGCPQRDSNPCCRLERAVS